MIQVAINGYGRIGRNILRAYYERPELKNQLKIVAVNDPGNLDIHQHLTQYDSVHGRFAHPVERDGNCLVIGDDRIAVLSEREPDKLPWQSLGIDVVCECTGRFTRRAEAVAHLDAGARKVLISAPGSDADATVVFGVNEHCLRPEHRIVSNASCTTNCLAPLAKPLSDNLGIESGFLTTVHSYTNDQRLTDVYHDDIYRARAATQSMIPTKTGAAAAIGQVLPELAGRLEGIAIRVPTINVSLVDFTFLASRDTDTADVNAIMAKAVNGDLGQVLSYNTAPLVSVDYNHTPFSSNFDSRHTRVNGRLVKVLSWYDNEWGFSNRMLDTCLAMFRQTGVERRS